MTTKKRPEADKNAKKNKRLSLNKEDLEGPEREGEGASRRGARRTHPVANLLLQWTVLTRG
jgi:hypothetical protein